MAKTVVLDDDPTGTQSASGVRVLLRWDADRLTETLRGVDAVYLQTNSRAIDAAAAVALGRRIRAEIEAASTALGERVDVVLRGDSTLRGHVFAETDVFTGDDTPILFLPAFPAGGRTTLGGVHYVLVDRVRTPAHETEYAADPVSGFRHGDLVGYVRETW
ncbi:four-carbon acid sugar kinase family protein [Micromonospora inyonensis]|uniref:Putative sugar-binding N-terminal domain-containing protein n=1 Tax=Micromonospora inyonensis TaxID=47866 RepID=A0A1C6S9E5_9ACTN|nr:four-carbon acid sugar kinase family protein [Micromonospora inyonensis]SCL26026.1 Putative sugar-binding N-terminal domain-containing protein [Micromonospora inyonensis]